MSVTCVRKINNYNVDACTKNMKTALLANIRWRCHFCQQPIQSKRSRPRLRAFRSCSDCSERLFTNARDMIWVSKRTHIWLQGMLRYIRDTFRTHPVYRDLQGHCVVSLRQHSFLVFSDCNHRRRSSVDFRGHKIFARKICMKNSQNTRILHGFCPKNLSKYPNFMTLARKINKIPEFYMIFARKFPNLT